jgi:hypothetical protein
MTSRKPAAGLLSLLCIALTFATATHAQTASPAGDASRQAKAEQLFALMRMEQTYAQLMTQVTDQTDQMIKQVLPEDAMSDAQQKQLAVFKVKVNAMVADMMSWTALEPDYVKLYADTYSEDELDGIIVFYRSPVGQKMLAKTPDLMKASSVIAMNHMGLLEPKLKQMMDDFERQVKAGPDGKSQ